MDEKIWLKSGEQSKVDDAVMEVCSGFSGSQFEKVCKAVDWISRNLKRCERRKL